MVTRRVAATPRGCFRTACRRCGSIADGPSGWVACHGCEAGAPGWEAWTLDAVAASVPITGRAPMVPFAGLKGALPMRRRLVSAAVAAVVMSGISAPHAFAAGVNDQDEMFMRKARYGHLAEIAAGQDTRKNATTSCVRHVGAVLVRDHSKLNADVKALADKLNVTLPGSLPKELEQKLAELRAKVGGSAYDAAWLEAQHVAHRATLALIDQELSAGQNPEVKAAARAARPVVAMHLDMVRGGTCHEGKDVGMVRAGTGGQLTAADGALATVGLVSMAGGGLLAALGASLLWRGRRPLAGRR